MTRRPVVRLLLAVALLALTTALPAPPAGAAPILDADGAIELANKLAEATEDQDVCYGWIVTVVDEDGISSGVDTGSSLGPDRSPLDPGCSPSVIFVADLLYTSELSEAADSATFGVESTIPGFDATDISSLGVSESALLGDDDDLAVFNATSLLPLLVAEQGLAPPVAAEQTVGTIPAADGPTGRGGSDHVRTYGSLYFLTGLLVVAGLGWLVLALWVRWAQTHDPNFAVSTLFHED